MLHIIAISSSAMRFIHCEMRDVRGVHCGDNRGQAR